MKKIYNRSNLENNLKSDNTNEGNVCPCFYIIEVFFVISAAFIFLVSVTNVMPFKADHIMDYNDALLFFGGLGFSGYFFGLLYQKIESLTLITIATSAYFILFVIISGFFFWADCFQMEVVLLSVVLVFATSSIGLIVARKKYRFLLDWTKRSPVVLLIIFIGFLISFVKFDFFGMGQDQGVYQTKAIALAYGETSRQLAFDEINNLPTKDLQNEAMQMVKGLAGFDFFDSSKPTLNDEEKIGDIVGIFHGIPTFPALLAFFTKMFGISNMQQIQSVFYLCTAFFILLITERLSLQKNAQILAVSVVAFSPIVQWVMKSALTEAFLCLMYAGVLFGLIDRQKCSKYLSVLFVWGFAFFHVTIYVMIPLFVVLFILMYFETQDKHFLVANGFAAMGFAVGITMMCYVSPSYSFNNISNGFSFFRTIGEDKALPFMWCLCTVFIGLSVLVNNFDLKKIYMFVTEEKFFTWFIRSVMVLVMIFVCFRGYQILIGDVAGMVASRGSLRLLTLVVFTYGTGIFAFCVMLIEIFIRPKKMLESKEYLVIGTAFFYCVLLMSAFIRKEIRYLYYYSRYLAPYIVICAITIGAFLGAYSKRVLALFTVCGAAVLLPFDWTLATQKDDSRIEWDIVEDIVSMRRENSAIIMEDYWLALALPLKTAGGFDVYPVLSDFNLQLNSLSTQYDGLYIVSSRREDFTKYDIDDFSIVYRNQFISSEDDNSHHGRIVPFAYNFTDQKKEISIYEHIISKNHYDFAMGDFPIYGAGIQEDWFRWLYESGAGFTAYLRDGDYEMHLTLGSEVPLENLGRDFYSVDVFVNDLLSGTITLLKGEENSEYTLFLPKEIIVEGKNDIRFYAEPWSSLEYGSGDDRNLTISLSQIDFVQLDNLMNFEK